MSESKKIFRLVHNQSRQGAAAACMQCPDGWFVTFSPPTRKLEHSARLHCMLQDISRQLKYMGAKRDVEFWKGLFVSGWQIATGERPEIVPGLEGEFINIRESTTTLSGKRMASLIEYLTAWAEQNGIEWTPVPADESEWRR